MTGLGSSRVAGSEAAQNHTFGVLKLTLHASSYDWQFVPIAGKTWTDSGSGQCHGPAGSPLVPPPPAPSLDRTPPAITNLRLAPPFQAPHGVPLHPLGAGVREIRRRPPPWWSALSAGRKVHAGRGGGDQHAPVPLRRGRKASEARQVQGEGRGARPRWQLLQTRESEVPDRSLTSPMARVYVARSTSKSRRMKRLEPKALPLTRDRAATLSAAPGLLLPILASCARPACRSGNGLGRGTAARRRPRRRPPWHPTRLRRRPRPRRPRSRRPGRRQQATPQAPAASQQPAAPAAQAPAPQATSDAADESEAEGQVEHRAALAATRLRRVATGEQRQQA